MRTGQARCVGGAGRTKGVVVIGNHIGESVGDVAASDDLLCFPGLVGKLGVGMASE